MPRCRLRDRRAAILAVLYFVALIAASLASTPRRVGDGGEYVVMAMQLASLRPPSVSAEDLQRYKQEFASLDAGFDSSLLDYPDLVGRDGRQDFLHHFLYPLVVAPALPIVEGAGLHPNWAFTLVNALLLSGALFAVARGAPLVAGAAAFASPIVWWVDKAHTEAFLYAAVVVAAMVFRRQPSLALLAFACAGAQNAALGAVYPVFAVLVWLATRRTTFSYGTWLAAACGVAIVASPFVYSWVRLGRWSPMAEYAQRVLPTPGGVAAFIFEPNIGLVPSAPVYGVALLAAAFLVIRSLRGVTLPSWWWWPAVIQVLLLLAWSQNPNANHGGTPGVNRWVLSLLALSLPWIAHARDAMPHAGRVALNVAVAVMAMMSAAAHLPARAEHYLAPTPLAERLWSRGWMHVTPAEVFAERTQGREPAAAPAHGGACRVMLVADQQAPVQCLPPADPLPAWCRHPGAMCYAIAEAEATRYVQAPNNGFFYRAAEASWPAGGPLAAGLRRVLQEASPGTRLWRAENPRRWRERLPGADVGAVLVAADAIVIYVPRTSPEGRAALEQLPGSRVVSLLGASPLGNLAAVVPR